MKLILVASGSTPGSTAPLARAFEIARAHNARVQVIHVARGLDCLEFPEEAGVDGDAVRRSLHGALSRQLRDAVDASAVEGVDWDIRIESGSAAAVVAESARALGADLVIVGAHDRPSFRVKMLGSTADKVVRAAPVPVLVVRRPVKGRYRGALVGVDFSEYSVPAARATAALCPGVRLDLMHVVHVPLPFQSVLIRSGEGRLAIPTLQRMLITRAEGRLREIADGLAGESIGTRVRIKVGEPAATLVRATWHRRIELAAVGPCGHAPMIGSLLGQVSLRLLREAACDVLVARAIEAGSRP